MLGGTLDIGLASFERLACGRDGYLRPPHVYFTGSANRTHTEEFYEVADVEPDLVSLQAGWAAWEVCYNTIRPHQALGYLTPAEYLDSIGLDV